MSSKAQRMGPGTIVGDKYRLERVLGRGGMGMVIEAKHVQLGTSFALKFLHRSILGTESVTERFLREARATAALRSEHVCRVFDVGSFDGTPYLVMELLEGTDLEKVLRREKRLSPQVACNYLIQACAGVSEAHAAQIVHRDLKPGNLFLVERADGGSILKVLDFGIAKAPHETELGLTGTNAVLGSPAYMSLEQLRSSRLVDARSDIWSLGVILYELVVGTRPFHGEGVADLALRIAEEPMPRLPDDVKPAKVRAALDAIIGRCLAREPGQRYQSVAEFALAIAPFADEPERRIASSLGRTPSRPLEVISAEASRPPTDVGMETTVQSAGAIENLAPARRARARTGWVVLAASIAVGASLGVVTMSDDGASPDAHATTRTEPVGPTAIASRATVVDPSSPPAPAAVAPVPVPVAAPPVPESAPSPTITLRFAIEPAGAAVELDGVFVTARQITVRRDDEAHRLRISAPGYLAQERELHLDDNQKLIIQLRRPAVAPAAVAPARQRRIESKSPYE